MLRNAAKRLLAPISSGNRPAISTAVTVIQSRCCHEPVVDRYSNPRNAVSLDKSDPTVGTGFLGAPAFGDVMKLQIKADEESGKIVDACFKTFGCGPAIASSSVEERREPNKLANDSELVLDGGFVVPDANAFGQTFRDYEAESERRDSVEEFYRLNHIHQSVEFVKQMREKYGKLNITEMSIWKCCELLNEVVDESDPDLDEPQIEHLLQTAEAIRKDYPNEDWLHLTGLIHDLGKVLLHPKFGELPQWAVVGDIFPVGCAFHKSNVHWKYFEGNEDWNNPKYNTKNGIYSEGCGLENVSMSWGHDDYMYLVAKKNKTTLPSAALFIIRYHSFYPLHKFGAYKHLMNDEDKVNMKWLQLFNKYDLYSKCKVRVDVEKVKPYYLSLIEKYFPAKLKW